MMDREYTPSFFLVFVVIWPLSFIRVFGLGAI